MRRALALVAALAAATAAPASATQWEFNYAVVGHGVAQVLLTPDMPEPGKPDAHVDLASGQCDYDIVQATSKTDSVTVAVAGQALAGARTTISPAGLPSPTLPVDTEIVCTVFSNSVSQEFSRSVTGPSVAVAGVAELPPGKIKVCVKVAVLFSDNEHLEVQNTC